MAHKDFIIGLDNRPFIRTLQETSKQLQQLQNQVQSGQGAGRLPNTFGQANKEAQGLNLSMGRMAGIIGATFGVATISQFAQRVAQTRGEFQQLEIAFNTMLGSKTKADKLMSQLVQSAAKTPFDLQGIASGAKQLLAYGVEADKINDRLLKLGDIAAGLSLPLGDLVYLYGTTMTQGRMYTRDMIQFMGRGIPLAEELAKQFGVSKDKVSELVTAGKVGAKEFEKAIDSIATGKFNGLMEKQSKSITGQLSNLGDSISVMFNEIGKTSEGVISGSIGAVATLVENYEKLGKVLATLIATYGAFKTAVYVANATKGLNLVESIMYMKMLGDETIATSKKVIALKNAMKFLKANPWVLLVTGIVAVAGAIWALKDRTTEAEKAQARFNERQKETNKLLADNKALAQSLLGTIKNENETTYERYKALKKLQALYPKYLANLSKEQLLKMSAADFEKLINKGNEEKAFEARLKRITELEKQIKEKNKAISSMQGQPHSGSAIGRLQTERDTLAQDLKVEQEEYNKAVREYAEANKTAEQRQAELNAKLKEAEDELAKAEGEVKRLNSSVIDTSKILGGKFQLNVDLTDAQSRVEAFTGIISELKQQIDNLGGANKKDSEPKKDKSYWKKQRDDAQTTIDGLTTNEIKKKTEKYRNAIKDLNEAQRQLDLYSTKQSKSGKAYDPTKDKEAIKRYTEEIVEAKEQSALEIRQATEIKGKEGYERELILIQHNYQRQLAEIKRYEKQLLDKRIENERNKYKTTHGGSDKEFNAGAITLDEDSQSLVDARRSLAEKTALESRTKLLEDYALQVQTYEEQVAEVKRKYADIIKAIEESKTLTEEQKTNKRIEATKKEAEAIKQVQEEALSKYNLLDLSNGGGSDLVEQSIKKVLPLFHDLSSLSFKELQKAKTAIKGIKIDPKTLKELEKAGVDIESLQKKLKELKNGANGQVQTELFKNIIKNVEDLGDALQNVGGQLSSLGGEAGEIGDTISQIGGIASSGIGLAKSIMAEDVLGSITNGVQLAMQIGKLFDTDNEKETNKRRKELSDRISQLDKSLEKLNKTISEGYGASAVKSAEDAIQLQKEKAAKIRAQLSNEMAYYKGSHSNKYRFRWFNEQFSELFIKYWGVQKKFVIDDIKNFIGRDITKGVKRDNDYAFNSMMNLTPEEMDRIRREKPDWWADIKDIGYYDKSDDIWEKYADQAGKIQEINDNLVNAITGISFEGLRDDFVEQLMNMEASTEDFGKNISKIMQKSMLKTFVDDKLSDKMRNWKKKLDEMLLPEHGGLTEEEVSRLRAEYLEMVKDGQERAKQIAQITGYNQGGADPRTASAKGIAQASQESVNELNGLMHTSVMIQERIHKAVEGVGFDRFADIGQKVAQEVSLIRQINTSIKDTNERVEQNTKAIHNVLSDIKREGLNMKR